MCSKKYTVLVSVVSIMKRTISAITDEKSSTLLYIIADFRRSIVGRFSEIEIYGFKPAEETTVAKSDPQREDELVTILDQTK